MANNFENKSFVPAGFEIVSYDDQETKNWRECTNNVIAAEPISWRKPNEAFSEVEGDGSTGKRKSELEVETEKEFSLVEIYKYSNNIEEIISHRERDGITLDSRKLLKNLKGWTVKTRTYPQKNGRNRVDKTYGHPKSKRFLRSTVEIMKFIEEISCIKQASKGSERVTLQDAQDATTKMYLQISRRLQETFGSGVHQTWNNDSNKQSSSSLSKKHEAIRVPETAWGATFKSHDTVDYSPHSHWPSHYLVSCSSTSHGVPLSSHMIHVPKSEKISDSSEQVFTNGQESVRTFDVGVHQTWNNGSNKQSSSSLSKKHEAIRVPETAWGATFKSHDTVDYSPHSHRPSHYPVSFSSTLHGVPLSSPTIHIPQLEKISDSSKQVFTNGQECVRTFGVGPPACYDFGASSSSKNIASFNEIQKMVQSQLETQIEAKVAAQVAEKVSHYEKAQKKMAKKMESMERLLVLGGLSPPFQFQRTPRS